MSAQNKPNTSVELGAVDPNTQDEIEQIMNEIEELQRGMNGADAGTGGATQKPQPSSMEIIQDNLENLNVEETNEPAVTAPVAAAPARPAPVAAAPAPAPAPAPVMAAPVAAAPTPSVSAVTMTQEEEDILKEFQGGAGDAGMEETLASLPEEKASTNSILDQPMVDEISAQIDADAAAEEAPAPAPAAAIPIRARTAPKAVQPPTKDFMNDLSDAAPGDGTLTMMLTGNMTMKIMYACDGMEVTVGFADQALKVQLADGTEFKIPVKRAASKAAAA